MKFFKTHLSLIIPLLFMMFAFEFILFLNATLKHYEQKLNKDYNIILISSTKLDENVLKSKISKISSLEILDPKALIDRLKSDISDKNLKVLQDSLPFFYSVKLDDLLDQNQLNSLKDQLLKLPSVSKVETFAKTHDKIYSLLVLINAVFWMFLLVIILLSFALLLKQMKIWLFEHSQRVEIMILFGAPFWFRSLVLYKMVFFDCLIAFLLLLLFFTKGFSLPWVQESLAQIDLSLPQVNFFLQLGGVFIFTLFICFLCVNSVMFKVTKR